jgi:carnitine 3-dehydrogenase
MAKAVADADFVQENAPERPELKVKLFAQIAEAARAGAIIASTLSAHEMEPNREQRRHRECRPSCRPHRR